jgi:hypothetical protein
MRLALRGDLFYRLNGPDFVIGRLEASQDRPVPADGIGEAGDIDPRVGAHADDRHLATRLLGMRRGVQHTGVLDRAHHHVPWPAAG